MPNGRMAVGMVDLCALESRLQSGILNRAPHQRVGWVSGSPNQSCSEVALHERVRRLVRDGVRSTRAELDRGPPMCLVVEQIFEGLLWIEIEGPLGKLCLECFEQY